MRAGLYLALAMIAGAVLANLLLADPGYVGLRFAGYLIEMSIPTLLLLGLAGYFLSRLLMRAVRARSLLAAARLERRQDRARRSLTRGITELSRGDWAQAENTALEAVPDSPAPVANYLLAARAAELQGATQRRDDLLTRALETSPEERGAVLIMQAELHLKHKELKAARATLEQLEASGEQNPRGLVLLARIYDQLGEWQLLKRLEPRLRSARGLAPSMVDKMLAQTYLDQIKVAAAQNTIAEVRKTWEEIPSSYASRPELIVAYARAAMACGDHDLAEKQLRELLEREWDEAAVSSFGELEGEDALRTLETAESWLPAHSEDASLLLACARLCIRAELYGKARSYLETSLAIRPRLETYHLLASLMEQLGDHDRAYQALNAALAHAMGRRPELPKIRARRWLDRRHNDRRRS
jgi:HemY protein